MQWLVHQVLGAGQRSPPVMALAALHLAPLFLACPPAALFYQQHIKKLLLFDAKHASPEVCLFCQIPNWCIGRYSGAHVLFMQTWKQQGLS